MTAHDRLPPIPESLQTEAQKQVVAALIAGSRGSASGPFMPMLRSPEMLDLAQRLGEYLRFRSVIPKKLRELAILATARFWQQTYEWYVHAPIACEAGLSATIIESLAQGEDGAALPPDEQTVLQFCRDLHRNHAVSDSVYGTTKSLLGEDGIIELCGICGYYALLAMVMNVARTPTPSDAMVPFAPPP